MNLIEDDTPTVEKTAKAGYKYVSRAHYTGKTLLSQEEDTEQVMVADFQGEPTGRVTVGAHITKNLGNFESAKVSVEVSMPCLASEEEAVRVYAEVSELVTDMINEQLEGIKR